MNKIIQLLLGTMAISLLAGCLSTEDQNVENVSISSPSELYGAWLYKSSDVVTGYMGDNTTPYYYVLGENQSYLIQADISPDSVYASFVIIPLAWSVSNGNVLKFFPNVPHFIDDVLYPYPQVSTNQVRGIDSAVVYTVSNLDSVLLAVHMVDSIARIHNEEGDNEQGDSSSLVIIQHLKDSKNLIRGYEQIITVKEPCFRLNEGVKNMKDVCPVTIFEKDTNLDLTGILSRVDTVSSTSIWNDLLYKQY